MTDTPFIVALDDVVSEPYIEICAIEDKRRVVAVIEILSSIIKTEEAYHRVAYRGKRDQFILNGAHFIDIDLLREGAYSVAVPRSAVAGEKWDYLVSLRCAGRTNTHHFWPASLRSRLPRISIPLTENFPDVIVDLQAFVNRVYDDGLMERRIDYAREPVPPLSPDDAAWADALLKTAGFR